jgi:hypothetical protein
MTDFFAEKKASEKAFRDNLNKYLLSKLLISLRVSSPFNYQPV